MLSYKATLQEILQGAYSDLYDAHSLTFKNSFGAVAGYVDGNIFCAYGRFGFALKLPRDIVEQLLNEEGAKALRYFPKGHIKKDYAVLPPGLLEDAKAFKKFLTTSVMFVTAR